MAISSLAAIRASRNCFVPRLLDAMIVPVVSLAAGNPSTAMVSDDSLSEGCTRGVRICWNYSRIRDVILILVSAWTNRALTIIA
jgi:hypothetical protein